MSRVFGLVILMVCCAVYHALLLTTSSRANVHSQRLMTVARSMGDFLDAERPQTKHLLPQQLLPPPLVITEPLKVANQASKSIISTMVIPMLLSSFLGIQPAAAKSVVRSVVSPERVALDSMRTQQLRLLPKWLRKIYRIGRKFLSGSVKGSNGAAGGDNVMLPALVRSSLIITVGIVLATVMLRWEDFAQTRRLKKEIHREMKYREDMFIDAVSDLITKIEDPKVKPAIKEELKKELRDLDAKGEIQAFVKGRGPRPDLSTRITESMRKKTVDKEKAAASARAKQEQQRQREQQALDARQKAEEEEQARERKRLKIEADILRKQQQQPDSSTGVARRSGSGAATAAAAAVPPNRANQRHAAVDFNDDHSHQRRSASQFDEDEDEDEDDDNYLDEDDEDEEDADADQEEEEGGGGHDRAATAIDAASNKVLARLNAVLLQYNRQQGREVVSSRARQLLIDEFTRRLQQVDDVARRQEIIQRIEQRLDNVPYWVEYSQRLVEENDGDEDYDDDDDEEEEYDDEDDSDVDEINA